jgi:hypothetical protein
VEGIRGIHYHIRLTFNILNYSISTEKENSVV